MGVPQPPRVPKPKKNSRPLSESRKVRKPLMEKRRRDRINACLNSLAALLVGSSDLTSSDLIPSSGNKKSRLEKADILEQTVQHWLHIDEKSKENQNDAAKTEDTSVRNESPFLLGYKSCMAMVDSLLKEEENVKQNQNISEELRAHLHDQLRQLTIDASDARDDSQSEICETDNINEKILIFLPKMLPSGDKALIMQEFSDKQMDIVNSQETSYSEILPEHYSKKTPPILFKNNITADAVPEVIRDDDLFCDNSNVWRPWYKTL